MRCPKCEYRLWGVSGRECPECGTAWRPSQFEFVPNSVRFCCPHCQQDYYGTAERGYLVPEEFDCVRCGRHVHMDQMTLFPTAGLQEEQTDVERMPWLDRKRIGFFRAWLRTIRMGMLSPGRLMQLTPSGSSIIDAFWFALLTGGIATLGGMLPFFVFPFLFIGRQAAGAVGVGFVLLLLAMAWPVIAILIWGTATHGILALTGRRPHGLSRTFQALSYTSAANIVTIVPCLGFYLTVVAWTWWLICSIVSVREGQRTSTGRAGLAVSTFPVLLLVSMVCLFVFVALPGIQSAQATAATVAQQATNAASDSQNLATLATTLRREARKHGGTAPGHASELIAAGVPASTFLQTGGPLGLSDVFVAGRDLQQFSDLPESQQLALTKAAAQALGPNPVVHRLGDFVFTYHGINFNKADPALWIVVFAPDKPIAQPIPGVYVGLADGTTTFLTELSFAQALQDQNALRSSQGLPPLPDPRKVADLGGK